MAVACVEDKCRVQDGKLVIVVEGDTPEAVNGPAARQLAIEKAAMFGYTRVGINGHSGSYPVDAEGNEPANWEQINFRGKIAKYRNDYKLMSGL